MSYSSRPLPSHLRQPSTTGNANAASTGQSPILLARINEKKIELENLKQLRDLSAGLAGQMTMLEEKLATLTDGTEGMPYLILFILQTQTRCTREDTAVALVLGNWHNVLRTISMASMKLPKPKDEDGNEVAGEQVDESEVPLPQTLVRIPTKDAPKLQQVESGGDGVE